MTGGFNFGNAAGGLFSMVGAIGAYNRINQARKDVLRLPGMQGSPPLVGNFGRSAQGNFQMDPQMLAAQQMFGQSGMGMMGGGLFNDLGFQSAFHNNDMFGALNQSNAALQQQMGNSAFGGLGGMFGGAMNMANMYGQALTGNTFGQTQASELDAMRAAAAPQNQRNLNQMNDRLFAMGMLGNNTTQTGEAYRGYNEALNQQDANFQTQAFDRALQQRNFQQGAFGDMMGLGAGLEGQAFSQALQGLQQNQSAGMNRLSQAMGLFGQGNDIFAQNYGLGQNSLAGMLDFGRFGLDAAAMPYQLQAELLKGSSGMSNALIESGRDRAGAFGGMMGGIAKGISGLFSDRRLKENVKHVGYIGEHKIYTWDWNEEAKKLGIDNEYPPVGVIAQEAQELHPEAVSEHESGYLTVNYEVLFNG